MILSCILLRKMDSVVVSGFGAAIGLGMLGEIWALAKDAKTETNTMPKGTTTRAMDRNIKKPHLTGLWTRCDLLGPVHVASQKRSNLKSLIHKYRSVPGWRSATR